MKIEPQTNPERVELAKLIGAMHIAMLTTNDESGALASKPMTPLEMDADGTIWFYTARGSRNTEYRQAANLAFADVGDATYVSVSGQIELVDDRARIRRLWTSFAKPWFPGGPESLDLTLLKFVPRQAEYWDSTHGEMVRMFALAVSVVAGRPVGLGEHQKLHDLSGSSVQPT